MEELRVVMGTFALSVDADTEGGDFIGEIGKLVLTGEVAGEWRVQMGNRELGARLL